MGSTNVSLGYAAHNYSIDTVAFIGGDSENTGNPTTDWANCQTNARTMYLADTTLSTPFGSHGTYPGSAFLTTGYPNYGSYDAYCVLGRRYYSYVDTAAKVNGNLFTLTVNGYRRWFQGLGAPTYTYIGGYFDSGSVGIRLTESPTLFSSGGHLAANFGLADLTVTFLQLNNAQRAYGKAAWEAGDYAQTQIVMNLPTSFFRNMVGNDLYMWVYKPFEYLPYVAGSYYSKSDVYMTVVNITSYY